MNKIKEWRVYVVQSSLWEAELLTEVAERKQSRGFYGIYLDCLMC